MNPKINPLKNYLEIVYDKIRGFEYGKEISIELELNENTTINKIKAITDHLDFRTILVFYDAYYKLLPNQIPCTHGDTGVFTEVIKDGNNFKVRLGSHGGFKLKDKWTKLSEKDLINRMYKSRMYNGGKMKLKSRLIRMQWIKTEKGKTLYGFYHDISDKKTCAITV